MLSLGPGSCRRRCQLLGAMTTQAVCGYHLGSHQENRTTLGVLSRKDLIQGIEAHKTIGSAAGLKVIEATA